MIHILPTMYDFGKNIWHYGLCSLTLHHDKTKEIQRSFIQHGQI